MRYLPARICPVGVQTSHLGVLSAGNCGVKTFDHLSAHQPAGDSGAELQHTVHWGVGK